MSFMIPRTANKQERFVIPSLTIDINSLHGGLTVELLYNDAFFDGQQDGSYRSAKVIVPFIIKLLQPLNVVDVGCGRGTWLAAFIDNGVTDVVGIDGEYIDRAQLYIPQDTFQALDIAAPFSLTRIFDLVVCLEVAEHLPESHADSFVRSLCRLGPAALFSAAIPYQGGTNHQNEQWQDYWVRKFQNNGYIVVDCLRPAFWNNPDIDWWYRQNMMLFIQQSHLASLPDLAGYAQDSLLPISVAHPECYMNMKYILETYR